MPWKLRALLGHKCRDGIVFGAIKVKNIVILNMELLVYVFENEIINLWSKAMKFNEYSENLDLEVINLLLCISLGKLRLGEVCGYVCMLMFVCFV